MRAKSRKIIIFISLLIISVSLSFSGVFAEIPITGNEGSQLLQISQTPFDTRDVYINRLIDWQCFYQTGSMATFVTDPSDHNSGTVYGSFYKKSDYTQLVFDFYNENKSMGGIMSFNWTSYNIKDINVADAYGTTSIAVLGYNTSDPTETAFTQYVRLWNYVTHNTINQDPHTVVLNWTDSEHEIVDCDADADWTHTNFDSVALDNADYQEGTGSIKGTKANIAAFTQYWLTYDPAAALNMTAQNVIQLYMKWTTTGTTVPYGVTLRFIDGSSNQAYWWIGTDSDYSWTHNSYSLNDITMIVGAALDWDDIDSISMVWQTGAAVDAGDTLTLWMDSVHTIEGVRGGTAGEYDFPKDKIYSIVISMVPTAYDDGDNTPLPSRNEFNVTISNYQMPAESTPTLTQLSQKLNLGTSLNFDNLYWLTPSRIVEELQRRGYKYLYHYVGYAWKFMELDAGYNNGDLNLTTVINEAFEQWHKAFFEELNDNGMEVILAVSLEHNWLSPHEGMFQRDCNDYKGWSEWIPTSAFVSPTNETARAYYRAVYANISQWAYDEFGSATRIVSAENWWWYQGWRSSPLTADAASGQKQVTVEDGSLFSAGDTVSVRSYLGRESLKIDSIAGNTITFKTDLTLTHQVFYYADVFGMSYPDRPFLYDNATEAQYLAEKGVAIYNFTSTYDGYASGNAADTVAWCNDALNDYVLNMSAYTKAQVSNTVNFGALTDPHYMPSGLMDALNDLPCYTDGSSLDFVMMEDYSAVMGKNWSQVDRDMSWVNYTSWYYLTGIVRQTAEANEPVFDAIIKAYQNEAEMIYLWSWHQQRNYGIDFLEWNAVISCELLNGKVDGTWVFTETNYYQFDSLYQNLDGWEAIHECYIGFSDGVHWISAKYDVQDQALTLLTGGDYVKLKAGTVENETNSDLSVIFKFYFKATLFDTQDINIYMKATQVDGAASEWSIVEENLFNLINNPQTRPKKR